MKKTYSLTVEGKNRDRLLEAAKHDIRKYAKRERARALPEGVDFWDFSCKTGLTPESAVPVHFAELIPAVDALSKNGDLIYVEVITHHGHRQTRAAGEPSAANAIEGLS